MATLPIRRMVLYKHGVGFFERRGPVTGQEVQFTFRREEINDALKSLTVIDQGGGQVLGVHYETPEDKEARLAESSISLSADHSLLDLLRSLRGRDVRLTLVNGGEVAGRLLGADVDEQAPLEKSAAIVLDPETQTVTSYPVPALRRLTLCDERAAHDLRFFLDTSMSEEIRRSVTVRLSDGAHDLSVFYLAPSPTWRVSYRVVGERDKGDDGASPDTGRLVLQGWGLFDNRLDEDLEDAQVTLVAGMPISFVYDLATSRIPERPVIEDEARVAAAPVDFEGAMAAEETAAPMPPPSMDPGMGLGAGLGMGMMRAMAAPAPMQAAKMDMDKFAASAQPTAAGTDLGELFQYAVTTPVSVKRGESAMVPILASQLPYRRELLYNGQKMPTNPVVALRCKNATGLTLERGPVTVVEDGDYRGEAIVPFTKADAELYLAYAVELGVKVTESRSSASEMAGLIIRNGGMAVQEWYTEHLTYTIENTTGTDFTVTIEKPKTNGYEPIDTPAPDAETAEHRRWRVACPARRKTEFKVHERTRRAHFEQILDQSYEKLQEYLDGKWLDREIHGRLKALLDEKAQISKNLQEIQALQAETAELYARQEQLRKNMDVVKDNEEEVQLRRRLRQQLEQTEDRLGAIEARIAELKADCVKREQRVQEELKKL